MKRLRPRQEHVQKEVRKAMDYFQTNKERMRYAQFRSQGLFVGSGVVEAGCKTIIRQRLKQSGMRWTVNHANAIIRSEERRVGKECRYRWSAYHYKKNTQMKEK